jgi:ADP-heptose:LPS heptosyltransferase
MGMTLAFVGGREEAPFAKAVQETLDRPVVNLVGKCSIRETMAVLGAGRCVIGGDTGLVHIAAAMGTPTIAVFGPTDAVRWGHNYPPHQVIQSPSGRISDADPAPILEGVSKLIKG